MRNDFVVQSESFLDLIIEELEIDILFECFLGILINSTEIDSNAVHVIPKENYKRNYRNDILPIPNDGSLLSGLEGYIQTNNVDGITIYTSRSAILDYLPENLYARPDNVSEFFEEENEASVTKEYENKLRLAKKKQREKEREELDSAKRFFVPLEIEYNKVRIARELNEVNNFQNFDQTIDLLWGKKLVANDKWKRFVRTLHLVNYVIGDKKKTTALIEFVLGTKIQLEFSINKSFVLDPKQRKTLIGSEIILGHNMSLGNSIYDYLEVCTIMIQEISFEDFYNYIDDQSEDKRLINEMIEHYFPLNVEVKIDFTLKSKSENTLERAEDQPLMVLGYSSTL